MHDAQLDLDVADVARLIEAQFPQWSGSPIERMPSSGTVNAMFRLDSDKVVRLPFVAAGSPDIAREARTLTQLAPLLTTTVPRVLGLGARDGGFPYSWSVLEWIPGGHPDPEALDDELGLAHDLASFVLELRSAPLDGAPRGYRSGGVERLRELDLPVRECLAQASDIIDEPRLIAVWEDAVTATDSTRPAQWAHCDLLPSNIFVDERGRLTGVLDWATAGAGDASADLLAAWNVLGPTGRVQLRERLAADDEAWRRGRGWALSQAAIALPYYRNTNPGIRRMALRALGELIGG
jgi:aminoglycoside phosphotransferase (APT) family kinase protein